MPKENSKPVPEPLHPTVAASDAFMCVCCLLAASICPSRVASIGYLLVATACGFGTLRFGLAPDIFRPFNERTAQLAGRVGVPLVGLGFLGMTQHRPLLPLDDVSALATLVWLYAISLSLSEGTGELYTTIIGVLAMVCVVAFGAAVGPTAIFAYTGVGLFAFGGLAIGSDREKCIAGIRRENLFHYCLGVSLLLMAKAAEL